MIPRKQGYKLDLSPITESDDLDGAYKVIPEGSPSDIGEDGVAALEEIMGAGVGSFSPVSDVVHATAEAGWSSALAAVARMLGVDARALAYVVDFWQWFDDEPPLSSAISMEQYMRFQNDYIKARGASHSFTALMDLDREVEAAGGPAAAPSDESGVYMGGV